MFNQILKTALALVSAVAISVPAWADHAWSNYHWARTTTSFDLTIVNSTTSEWDGYVYQATGDWSHSDVLNMVEENGGTSKKDRRQCRAPSGQVRICNRAYGQTGWRGIAGISIDPAGHISSGYTKLNDTTFVRD